MNDWVAQYLKIAKVALRGKKQLLEQIGVTARTTKTAAQRAAPRKAAATRAAKEGGEVTTRRQTLILADETRLPRLSRPRKSV